jgi:hypothetical protein
MLPMILVVSTGTSPMAGIPNEPSVLQDDTILAGIEIAPLRIMLAPRI